jgi:hypothetical protein
MKNRSPLRIVELCIYVLIIIVAAIWLLSGGRLYKPPDIAAPTAAVQSTQPSETDKPPLIVVPKVEIFPGQR